VVIAHEPPTQGCVLDNYLHNTGGLLVTSYILFPVFILRLVNLTGLFFFCQSVHRREQNLAKAKQVDCMLAGRVSVSSKSPQPLLKAHEHAGKTTHGSISTSNRYPC
jgi:hypothetical protein